ncbi:unnamed protein product [Gongylonema pulchrum]|uniref:Uncharacterized protein n=1 Tax=Gongylonema pulchrum TaxID=637853 RepID=A0A3P7PLE5_9BILA|nr:unnamed protein product [Gongylonema pulchrum]
MLFRIISTRVCEDMLDGTMLFVVVLQKKKPESPSSLPADRCMGLGAAHCSASERSMSSSWDQFGDSLAEAITKADSVRGKRECLKAWNALLSFIVDSMKGGYLAESKRRTSKKSSRQEMSATSSATAAAIASSTSEPDTYH